MIIAIDGPAGSGKSTIAKELAKKLGILYVDSGAMFRAITYSLIHNSIELSNAAVLEHLRTISVTLEIQNGSQETFLNGKNVSVEIRTKEVTSLVSLVSTLPSVREWILVQQRIVAENNDLIMDGRDIGTVVFPNATYKFFLTASLEERAKRRTLEMNQKGVDVEKVTIQQEIEKRDALDSSRSLAPLQKATDAIEIDTTLLTIEEVSSIIFTTVNKG
ncbi:MAG: (d)CMP kinase [Candidatus Kapabacteria bacterium]|nr:(d)CMP kinase [Candidatus Kapabacteria bacterium]